MDEEIQLEDNINDPYIKNLEVLILLLDKKLLIELFNEIHLLIPMKEMIKRFENSAILYWKNLKRNTATTFS